MFYRLGVGAGEEGYKIGYLQFFYKVALFKALSEKRLNWDSPVLWQSNYQLQVVPNSLLSIKQSSGVGFSHTSTHDDYKKLCGLTASSASPSSGVTKRVLVLDTGLDPASSSTVIDLLGR